MNDSWFERDLRESGPWKPSWLLITIGLVLLCSWAVMWIGDQL